MIELNKPFTTAGWKGFRYFKLTRHDEEHTILTYKYHTRELLLSAPLNEHDNDFLILLINGDIEYISIPKNKQEIDEWIKNAAVPFELGKNNYCLYMCTNSNNEHFIRETSEQYTMYLGKTYFGDNPFIRKDFIEFCGSEEIAIKYFKGELE